MFLTFVIECGSLDQFLDHWSTRYRDPNFRDRDKYDPYVGKPLTEESRRHLFEWKNGSTLSQQKSISVDKFYPLSMDKGQLSEKYLNPNSGGGAIWNLFYLHCVNPQTWPIFDQHTYRAMYFVKTGEPKEMPSRKADIYNAYQHEYIPFVKGLNTDQRKIDKALYSFGQFLKLASAYR